VIRALSFTRIYIGRFLASWVISPVAVIGRFLFNTLGIRIYRLAFAVKRLLGTVYVPAKNKILFVFTNRYALHFAIVVVTAVASVVNFGGYEVRAETFGENSVLFALSGDSEQIMIEETAEEGIKPAVKAVSYLKGTTSAVVPNIDYDYIEEDYVSTAVGGSALVAPAISEGGQSTAPRQNTETYTVQNGENIGMIAENYGVTMNTLLWANDLSSRSYIQPGQKLKIPPTSGVLHTVGRGESLNKIAKKYDVETEEILKFNRLKSASDIQVGEELMVPGGKKVAPRRVASVTSIFSAPPKNIEVNTTGSGSMVWPTDLRYITQYYGWRHNGLDVDCYYNNNNYAADSGTVVFAGWKKGYGLAVEIDHGGGLKTRYGHHASLYVSPGQSVSKGTPIGKCGTTGHSTGTHLHFEVMQNGRYQNPLQYIR